MKIKNGSTYKVNLCFEPNERNKHKIEKGNKGIFDFSGKDLIYAILSTGMPDVFLTKNKIITRREEIRFKINLFETFITSNGKGILTFDNTRKKYLDSTEIGAINYWIGMFLTTLIGQKKYGYEFMVHLTMLDEFSSNINLKKKPFFINGKTTYKSPDLISVNNPLNTFGVFESKGYSSYDKNAMENGFDQAKSIRSINNNKPKDRLVVMTITGNKEITMRVKDPEEGLSDININLALLNLYHFLPIVELIMELDPLEHKVHDKWKVGTFKHREDSYDIMVPLDLYEICKNFKEIANSNDEVRESYIMSFFESTILWEQYYLEDKNASMGKSIFRVEINQMNNLRS